MSYSQQSDLNLDSTRLIELTDNASAVGVIDSTLLTALSVEADAFVDGYLEGVYVTPIAATPAATPSPVRYASANIWRYLLYKHREVMSVPPVVKAELDRAIELLEKIAENKILLKGVMRVSASTEPSLTDGTFSADADSRIFGRARDSVA